MYRRVSYNEKPQLGGVLKFILEKVRDSLGYIYMSSDGKRRPSEENGLIALIRNSSIDSRFVH